MSNALACPKYVFDRVTPLRGILRWAIANLAPRLASWRSGYAADCKSVYRSSILLLASNKNNGLDAALRLVSTRFGKTSTHSRSVLVPFRSRESGRAVFHSGSCEGGAGNGGMITPSHKVRIFVAREPLDFRKGHGGLPALQAKQIVAVMFGQLAFCCAPIENTDCINAYHVTLFC